MTSKTPRRGLRTRAVHSGEAPGTDEMNENSFRLAPKQLAHYRELAGDGIFRLSVGLEDADDLCADLDQALG